MAQRDKSRVGADSLFPDPTDQKRTYDRWRRQRAEAFHHLYSLRDDVDPEVCHYCRQKPAETQDHSPSLLALEALGSEFFRRRRIPLWLIPACRDCNNDMGTNHAFYRGRLVALDLRKLMWSKRRGEKVRMPSVELARTERLKKKRAGTGSGRKRRTP